jgi:orotate phosphoribosyltransferase
VAERVADILLRTGAVLIDTERGFTYTSGLCGPIYCDNRLLISHVHERRLIVGELTSLLVSALDAAAIDVIAATATAGIPWAAWVAEAMALPLVYVRAEAKQHGAGRRVEGRFAPGSRLVIVEDLVTTAGSVVATAHALREENAVVGHCLAILAYDLEAAHINLEAHALSCHVLCTLAGLAERGLQNGVIEARSHQSLMRWLEGSGLHTQTD